jgi:hypothetical protein
MMIVAGFLLPRCSLPMFNCMCYQSGKKEVQPSAACN